jgi:hypothetical protein
MKAVEAFKEIFAADGRPDAMRLEVRRDDGMLSIDLHSTGNITLWWKGQPVEFQPLHR